METLIPILAHFVRNPLLIARLLHLVMLHISCVSRRYVQRHFLVWPMAVEVHGNAAVVKMLPSLTTPVYVSAIAVTLIPTTMMRTLIFNWGRTING
jgi:hypothetical protein